MLLMPSCLQRAEADLAAARLRSLKVSERQQEKIAISILIGRSAPPAVAEIGWSSAGSALQPGHDEVGDQFRTIYASLLSKHIRLAQQLAFQGNTDFLSPFADFWSSTPKLSF